ncbi:MAG: peptide-methionine (S)-S-oxide reductase MsrA [Vulcanimicrobiaceae bacterium]
MKKQIAALSFALAALTSLVLPTVARGEAARPKMETAVLAGGCFWGLEAVFEHVRGVRSVVAGYSGGARATAQYETVSSGRTGHAEAVSIDYDPRVVSYRQLLDVFFSVAHDPTQIDRQGPDSGPQYRSVVFYTTEAQRREASAAIARLSATKAFAAPIATQVVPYRAFYAAEAYHQHFFDRNPKYPYIVINDAPKVAALRERFPALVTAI